MRARTIRADVSFSNSGAVITGTFFPMFDDSAICSAP